MIGSVRIKLVVAAVACALVATACGAPYQIIRRSGPPSALKNIQNVVVQFDYAQMMVEGMAETDWVTRKTEEDADYPTTWADLKGRLESAYGQGFLASAKVGRMAPLGEAPQAGEGVLIVRPTTFKLGKYIPFVMPNTVVDANVSFVIDGQETDVIRVVAAQAPSIVSPSVFNHIGPVGNRLGNNSGRFFVAMRAQ